jgi:hypothetical protein
MCINSRAAAAPSSRPLRAASGHGGAQQAADVVPHGLRLDAERPCDLIRRVAPRKVVEHLELTWVSPPRDAGGVTGHHGFDRHDDSRHHPAFRRRRADLDRHVTPVRREHVHPVVGRPHAAEHLLRELLPPLVRALRRDHRGEWPSDAVADHLGRAGVLPADDPVAIGDCGCDLDLAQHDIDVAPQSGNRPRDSGCRARHGGDGTAGAGVRSKARWPATTRCPSRAGTIGCG